MLGSSSDGFSTDLEFRAYVTCSSVEGRLWGEMVSRALAQGHGDQLGVGGTGIFQPSPSNPERAFLLPLSCLTDNMLNIDG